MQAEPEMGILSRITGNTSCGGEITYQWNNTLHIEEVIENSDILQFIPKDIAQFAMSYSRTITKPIKKGQIQTIKSNLLIYLIILAQFLLNSYSRTITKPLKKRQISDNQINSHNFSYNSMFLGVVVAVMCPNWLGRIRLKRPHESRFYVKLQISIISLLNSVTSQNLAPL